MNKLMKFILPILCLQLASVKGDDVDTNEYSDEHFKAQLDGSFKKYFNENIYKIKEYSRERRYFNRRQDANESPEGAGEDAVQDLSCGGAFISQLKGCTGNDATKLDCIAPLTLDQFNAYLDCVNTDVPNYGNLVNSVVLNSLSDTTKTSGKTLSKVIMEVYDNFKFVAAKNALPYTTDAFIREMSSDMIEHPDDKKLISTNYLNCLKLVDDEIYSSDTASVCLCAYGYDKEIKGYSEDIKLQALYSFYGFSEDSFSSTCNAILSTSEVFNNENEFIAKLNEQSLLTLLREYNVPNYGTVFNNMMIHSLSTTPTTLKNTVYELYEKLGQVSVNSYNENDESHEFGRCMVQARNKIFDNSGLSYCLCNAGYNSFSALNEIFTSYGLDESTYNDLCSKIKDERNDEIYRNLGSSVEQCLDKVETNNELNISKGNYTECLDIGVTDSYLQQTKCLCDLYGAEWKNREFLSCYGYTELSFILGCRQFYPNQMFSDNPARGIENFYSENYDDVCGDSGTGGGHYVHDPCICKAREERQEVSLELEDICSRVGTEPGTNSAGFLSFKFSGFLIIFSIAISVFLTF